MYVYLHKWYTRPKEKDLRALPIQIPSNVAEKKSFTIKPPQDCSGSSTIGILFLELINQTWRKLYSHSHPKWSQTRIWGLHSLASWTLFSFLRRLPQIAAGAQVDFGPDLCDQGDQGSWGCQNQQKGRCNHICPSSWGLGGIVWAGREAGGLEVDSFSACWQPWDYIYIYMYDHTKTLFDQINFRIILVISGVLAGQSWNFVRLSFDMMLACREASWLEVHSLAVLGCLG